MKLNLQSEYDSIDYEITNDSSLKYAMKTIMHNLRVLNEKRGSYIMPSGYEWEFAENIVEELEDVSLEIETMRCLESFVDTASKKVHERLNNLRKLKTSIADLGYSK